MVKRESERTIYQLAFTVPIIAAFLGLEAVDQEAPGRGIGDDRNTAADGDSRPDGELERTGIADPEGERAGPDEQTCIANVLNNQ